MPLRQHLIPTFYSCIARAGPDWGEIVSTIFTINIYIHIPLLCICTSVRAKRSRSMDGRGDLYVSSLCLCLLWVPTACIAMWMGRRLRERWTGLAGEDAFRPRGHELTLMTPLGWISLRRTSTGRKDLGWDADEICDARYESEDQCHDDLVTDRSVYCIVCESSQCHPQSRLSHLLFWLACAELGRVSMILDQT